MSFRDPFSPRDPFLEEGPTRRHSIMKWRTMKKCASRHCQPLSKCKQERRVSHRTSGNHSRKGWQAWKLLWTSFVQGLAPAKCLSPVLPATINGKLVFASCKVCAGEKNQEVCQHIDQERCMEGVWTTPQLQHALDGGYRVSAMYKVWHWKEKKNGLFADYINKFLKVKMEAVDWPSERDTNEKKGNFIRKLKNKENIDLELDMMQNNTDEKPLLS